MREGRVLYLIVKYRTGAAGDSKGLQERDSKEPGLNHTAEQSPPRSQVPKVILFTTLSARWAGDCCKNGMFYNTIARQ